MFVINLIGTTLLILGAYEINFPDTISSKFPAISQERWKFIGITFFLFPVSFLVTLLRFPFRLIKWRH